MQREQSITASAHSNANLGRAFGLALALGAAGFGACDTSNHTAGLSDADYDQVAAALASLVGDDGRGQPNAFEGALLLAHGTARVGAVDGDVVFAENKDGLDYRMSAVCSDDNGLGIDCGDDATLAHVAVIWSGNWRSEQVTVSSAGFDADWILSDLAEDRLVLDGQATAGAVVAVRADDVEHIWRLDCSGAYSDVGIDAVTGRAVSGGVSYQLALERGFDMNDPEATRFFAVSAWLAFEPSGSAKLTLDGAHAYRVGRDGSVTRVGGSLD